MRRIECQAQDLINMKRQFLNMNPSRNPVMDLDLDYQKWQICRAIIIQESPRTGQL